MSEKLLPSRFIGDAGVRFGCNLPLKRDKVMAFIRDAIAEKAEREPAGSPYREFVARHVTCSSIGKP